VLRHSSQKLWPQGSSSGTLQPSYWFLHFGQDVGYLLGSTMGFENEGKKVI